MKTFIDATVAAKSDHAVRKPNFTIGGNEPAVQMMRRDMRPPWTLAKP